MNDLAVIILGVSGFCVALLITISLIRWPFVAETHTVRIPDNPPAEGIEVPLIVFGIYPQKFPFYLYRSNASPVIRFFEDHIEYKIFFWKRRKNLNEIIAVDMARFLVTTRATVGLKLCLKNGLALQLVLNNKENAAGLLDFFSKKGVLLLKPAQEFLGQNRGEEK